MFMHKYHCFFGESGNMSGPPTLLVSNNKGRHFFLLAEEKLKSVLGTLDPLEDRVYIQELNRIMRKLTTFYRPQAQPASVFATQ